jgi:hypothetical protein
MTNILIKVVAVVIAGGITLAIVDLAAPRQHPYDPCAGLATNQICLDSPPAAYRRF